MVSLPLKSDMRTSVFPLILSAAVLSGGLREAKDYEFPFQVNVKHLTRNTTLCSGVLVTPLSVLTVASCVSENVFVKISAGSHYKSEQNVTRTSTEVIIHPKYNATTGANNIAIILTEGPFPENRSITAAKLPKQGCPLMGSTNLSTWESLVDPKGVIWVIDNYTVTADCNDKYKEVDFNIDEFCGRLERVDEGSLASHRGIVYGLRNRMKQGKNLLTFVWISKHAQWIQNTLKNESSRVKWYGDDKSHSESPSAWMAATLLLALYLCK